MLAEARAALTGPFKTAYQELIAWQKEDRAKAPEKTSGVSALPNGAAYYNERLANQTTTTLTADEIHKIGLAEVARLRAEMVAIKDEVGFKGDLPAFFAELRDNKDNPPYYYPDTDEGRQAYIKDATAAIDKIKAVLPKYFGILPKADLVVSRVEAFREQPGAAQHYFPGTPDGSRPGIYYAHLSDMKAMPKSELEVIAYHEGLPGHHMQISIAQELTSVPTFRRQAGFTAYSEGWGLYSEWLAREMPGTYQDPVFPIRPARFRDLARHPSRGRHRPARQGMVRGAGRAVLPGQLGHHRSAGALGDTPLHGAAGPGDQLQDRHAQDPGAAAQGGSRRWARVSTSARSTTRCWAAARCR